MARPAPGEDIEEPLQRLGAKRVEATLLAMLLTEGAQGTKDIVDRTGLRQPEVSVGMQVLRERGWVEAEAVPRRGKGRPMHRYHLTVPPAAIRKHYESEGRKEIQAYKDAMQALKERLG